MTQLDALADFISPRVGLIRSLNRRRKSDDEPALPVIYDAVLAHYDFRKGDGVERGACGKGCTDEQAMLGAIGEAIEHYCASHPALKAIRRASASSFNEEWIDARDFVLFSEWQYARGTLPFSRWKPEDEVPWIRARDVASGTYVWVPAVLVYLNYRGEQPQDLLCAPTSNGLAAGPTLEAAVRTGTMELLERDAFLITWMNRLPVPEIDFSGERGAIGEIRSSYETSGTEIRLFLLATDMPISAVMAVALDRTGSGPAAIVGLGCDPQPREAVRKAVFEIGQIHDLLTRRFAEGKADRLNAYADVESLEDHAAYFFRRDHFHELDFLLSHGRKVPLGDIAGHDDAEVFESIRARGYRVFDVDVTTPDVRPYPIRAARVLITELQPIHFGQGVERLGGRRLYELPQRLGYTEAETTEETLNPCPHPLA
ncbi:MAG TPA: YcaO-like family protein [Bryobacteraceae bacterium]|nr:YcaO-like family protein [Bryobacteraceae bacterium]